MSDPDLLTEPPDTPRPECGTPAAGPAGPFRWGLLGALVLLVGAAYLPALRGEFVSDDYQWIVGRGLLTAPDALRRIWIVPETDQYQPLTYTSFWLERRLWGVNPLGYHLVNLVLHVANVVLVWRVLTRLRVRGAWAAALLFGLHPVNVESVAWIYERKNVLSGLFYLLTFLALFRFEENKRPGGYVLALVLFVLALLSKASTAVLPAVLLLCWWSQGRLWRARKLASVVPFFVLAAGLAALTILYEQEQTGAAGEPYASSMAERFARAGWIVWFYTHKLLAPYRLSFIYPRWSADPAALSSYVPHVVIAIALAVFLVKRRTWGRPALLGVGYYVIALFPVLGFLDIYYHRYSYVADHFQYLASIGPIALAVHSAACFLGRKGRAEFPTPRGSGTLVKRALVTVVVLACWWLCWQRSAIYRTSETLWADTLERNPDCWLAHFQLSEYLLRREKTGEDDMRKDVSRAAAHLQVAVALNPASGTAWVNLGGAKALLGRTEEAVGDLYRAVAAEPDNPLVHEALAHVLMQRQEYGAAIESFRRWVRLRPQQASAHYQLGFALCVNAQLEEGIASLREALGLRLDPPLDAQAGQMVRLAEQELARRKAATQPGPL